FGEEVFILVSRRDHQLSLKLKSLQKLMRCSLKRQGNAGWSIQCLLLFVRRPTLSLPLRSHPNPLRTEVGRAGCACRWARLSFSCIENASQRQGLSSSLTETGTGHGPR